ncbi:MAG: DUF4150 domain-containing protein [Deltaproteobacteria bacterium]|jgi:carboxyl-terminal processing protease|nr:DUF4150 domain-containing protein [Deltaproteobacteria bacterium]MBW2531478.1 DUF4150 domain-containing protein [Deltaproteobacteria bacterium]
MMPASNNGVGNNLGFPDVCTTPAAPTPVPVPYPNVAMNTQSATMSPNVFTGFMPALNMASVSPMTNGDNAGCNHPLFMQAGGQTVGNPIIFVNCVPAKNLAVPSYGNAFNNPTGATLVPSVTTTLYTDESTAHVRSADVDAGAARALRDAIDCDVVEDGPVVETRQLANGVVQLIVRRFVQDVGRRVHNALRSCSPRGVVLDLRGNLGGDAAASIELAEDLLPSGATIVTRLEGGDETVHRARGPQAYRWPLVVLVDERTASAAELLAGSLQANGRALVAGAATAGKGSAQQMRARPDGEGFGYETVAEYRLPDGRRLHGQGVHPDVVLGPEDDPLATAAARLAEPSAVEQMVADLP